MAGESVVGALRVVLGMDTASFEDGAKRASKSVTAFGTQMKAVFAGVGLERIVEGITHSLIELVKHSFENIDALGKQAQKVGIAVEEFSALKFAADLADVSMETLSVGLGKLSKNISETAAGTGDAMKTFEQLGINVRNADGTLKSVTTVLGEVADKFAGASDGVNKTAAAMALFGKSGKELIPLLNDGSHGIEEMTKVAQQMGLVISKDTAAQVQLFNDNLKILKLSSEGLANLIIAEIIPGLNALAKEFVETAKEGTVVRDMAQRISAALKDLIVVVNQSIVANRLLGLAFLELQKFTSNLGSDQDAAAEGWQNFKEIIDKLPESLKLAGEAMRAMLAITVPGRASTQDLNDKTSKLDETMAHLALQTSVNVGTFSQLAAGFPEMAARLKLTDEAGKTLSTTVTGLTAEQLKLNQAMLMFEASKLVVEAQGPWAAFAMQVQGLDALLKEGKIGWDQYWLAYNEGMLKAMTNLKSSFGFIAGGFKELAKQNKAFAVAAKGVAIATALINTYEAATKALTATPWYPVNVALAAATVVAGLGYVSQIQAQEFATGGSFKVGGGLGGIDNQMITFKAQPGEMVDIRRPGQDRGGGSTVNLALPARGSVGVDDVRGLIETINGAIRDGYRINLTAT